MQSITAPFAESISNALGGKRSGTGYKVPAFWRGSTDLNIYIADGDDGKLIAFDHSHGDDYKTMMEAFESEGLKPRDELDGQQREVFIQKKNKHQSRKLLSFELHMLYQIQTSRITGSELSRDHKFINARPEFVPMPDEPWERELLAVKRIRETLNELY